MKKIKRYKDKISKKRSQTFFGILSLAVLVLFVAGLIVVNLRVSKKREQLMARINELRKQITELNQKKEKLQNKIQASKNGSYLEEVARDQLNMKMPGEKVVAFPVENNQKNK